MKKYMIGFVIILSVLVGQDRYQFYLKSDDNLKLAGEENYNIIKTELDKMLADYNSKIDLDNYRKEKSTEKGAEAVPSGRQVTTGVTRQGNPGFTPKNDTDDI